MIIKNFALYGLFESGEFITSGTMAELLIRAEQLALDETCNGCVIATLRFCDNEDGTPNVVEGTKIISYNKIGDEIYVVNQLD